MSVVVLTTGLPGTGKTTVAVAAARLLPAVLVPHDWISAALTRTALIPDFYQRDIDAAMAPGYAVAQNVALANLQVGHHVVIDSIMHSAEARQQMANDLLPIADRMVQVWCRASDEALHRQLISARRRNIPGWGEVSWAHVERVRRYYEPPARPDLVYELGSSVEVIVHAVAALAVSS